MKPNKLRYFLIAVFTLQISTALFAQGFNGKIAGIVTDRETGEALPGVNIIIEGTGMGSATDLEGEYFILNIPPGHYDISAIMVGYQTIMKKQIKVIVDRTTAVNFDLSASLEETETVEVVAQRPTVIRDLTSTSKNIDAEEIQAAPIEGLREIMSLDAGVNRNPNGTISIRGGGGFDTQVQINGVQQVHTNTGVPGSNQYGDLSNTSWKYDFNPLGVEQVEIISGGFSAQYGNAQSGIVKVVTKDGGEKLTGDFRTEIRPPGKYHFGPYMYGKETLEWQKWGEFSNWQTWRDSNFPNPNAPEYINDDSLRTTYYDKWIANRSPGKNNESNPLGVYDYRQLVYQRYLFGFGGPLGNSGKLSFYVSGEFRDKPVRIPSVERSQQYHNYNLNLVWRVNPKNKIKFTTQYQAMHGAVWSGSDDIRWASIIGQFPTWKYVLVLESPKDEMINTQSVAWTHVFNPSTFMEVAVWHQKERMVERNAPVIQSTDPRLVAAGPWDENFRRIIYEFTSLYALDSQTDTWNLSLDLTSQITKRHQLKAGVQGLYWDTRYNGESGARLNAFIAYSGFAEYYHAYPYYIAAYIQDRMEFKNMIANIGVRFDEFNLNFDAPADRFRPFYPGAGQGGGPYTGDIGDTETKKPETHFAVSPRFGLSFPIGERTAFRLQYGHFYSMPRFRHTLSRTNWNGWRMYGNPDLGFSKTINYEVGVQQGFGIYRLDLAAYYNDRVRQVVSSKIHTLAGSYQQSPQDPYYLTYENNGYGASRGFELSFEKSMGRPWTYRLSYSFSRTSMGAYGAADIYEDPNDVRSWISRRSASDFIIGEDRTHRLRALATYHVPVENLQQIIGYNPFESMTLSMIYTAQSGSPYTYAPSFEEAQITSNNRRYPLEARTDMNLTARIPMGGMNMMFGVRISNLFDNSWLTPMDSADDNVKWARYGITMDSKPSGDPESETYKAQELNYMHNYYRTYRNTPREIYFTFGVGF
ncbi:MAG: TonB-dependent receptor [Calditrichales bacterium]|nr:MAG: TonB-dependent receptor [Calditrichales bacterium]